MRAWEFKLHVCYLHAVVLSVFDDIVLVEVILSVFYDTVLFEVISSVFYDIVLVAVIFVCVQTKLWTQADSSCLVQFALTSQLFSHIENLRWSPENLDLDFLNVCKIDQLMILTDLFHV